MININLLPDEFQKGRGRKGPFKFEITAFTGPTAFRIGGSFLAILIFLHLFFGAAIFLANDLLKKCDSRWQSLQPGKIEMERLKSEAASNEKIVSQISQLVNRRILWSKKLNQLSDLMMPGIWLTKVSIQTQLKDIEKGEQLKILSLEGCAAPSYGDETALVGKFIKALQEDNEFFKDFTEIKVDSLEKGMYEKILIMNFKVSCFLRKE